MQILVAGFQHETNSFANTMADWPAFESGDFFPAYTEGERMLALHAVGALPIGGFIQAARVAGATLIPACWAGASPSAPVTQAAYEKILAAILDATDKALLMGLDAVYLDLHGAAIVEHLATPELALLQAIRSRCGPDVPIVATLDLHANVDDALLSAADYLIAYRTYPHVDMVETGEAAYALLKRRLELGRTEAFVSARIPFLIPIAAQSTLNGPAATAYRTLGMLEKDLGGSPSLTLGFPASDVPHCGATIWAYGLNADRIVEELAAQIIDNRADWRPHFLPADEAVAEAMRIAEHDDRPVIIADLQDNPGAGTDSNTTGLLHALLRAGAGRRWPGRIGIGLINDPRAARLATAAGVGATLQLSLGKAVDTWSGRSDPPLEGVFEVIATHDAPVVLAGPMMTGTKIDCGPSACLQIDGICIVVSSRKTQMLDRVLYQMVGIDPASMKILVNKSAVHFRADFDAIASQVIMATAAGPMAADPSTLPWQNLRPDLDRTV